MAISNNPVVGNDIYSSVHIFFFDAPATDDYTFLLTNVDDDARFSIDNGPWFTAPLWGSATTTVNLASGLHKIILEYKQTGVGGITMRFLLPSRAGGTLPTGAGYQIPVNYSQLIGQVLQSIPNNASGLGTLERGVRGFVYDNSTTGWLNLTDAISTPFSTFLNDSTGVVDYSSSRTGPSTWPQHVAPLGNCVTPADPSQVYWATVDVTGSPNQTITVPAGIFGSSSQSITVTLNSPTATDITTSNFFGYNQIPCSFKNPDGLAARTNWDSTKTWTFSGPVRNPVLALYSLGQGGVRITLTALNGATFKHLCNATDPNNSLCIQNSTSLQGAEGYGILLFEGVFTSISIQPSTSENYCNYCWGLVAGDLVNQSSCVECPLPTPAPTPTPTPTPTPLAPCEATSLELDFVDPDECLNRSLAKINKNFGALESYLISLSTCCSLDPCVSCLSSTPPPTPTPTPTPTSGPTNCNVPLSFSDGGVSYPQIFSFELGAVTGNVNLFFNALQRPDRFICSIDGNILLDTGYYGASRYTYGSWDRSNFTKRLSGLTDPITGNVYPFADSSHESDGYPIINSAQLDTKSFSKTTSTSTCILCAFAPMLATYWEINMGCPT